MQNVGDIEIDKQLDLQLIHLQLFLNVYTTLTVESFDLYKTVKGKNMHIN